MASRLAEVSEEDVTILVKEGEPQKTKEATSYAVKVFEGKQTLIRTYLFQSYNVFDELKWIHPRTNKT